MDNIKIIRLQSGEDVIANYTQSEGDGAVLLSNPMALIFKRMPTGKAIMMMSPWLPLELVETNEAWLYEQDILTTFVPKQKVVDYYCNTVKEVEEDMLQDELHGDTLTDITDEFNAEYEEMSVEEEQEAMEELELLRQDVKKKLLH